MYCPECKSPLPRRAVRCSVCGAKLPDNIIHRHYGRYLLIFAAITSIAVAGIVYQLAFGHQTNSPLAPGNPSLYEPIPKSPKGVALAKKIYDSNDRSVMLSNVHLNLPSGFLAIIGRIQYKGSSSAYVNITVINDKTHAQVGTCFLNSLGSRQCNFKAYTGNYSFRVQDSGSTWQLWVYQQTASKPVF